MRMGIQGFQPQRLQQLRANAALTQVELAGLIQTATANISKWESGSSTPEATSLQKICEFFSVSMNWFLEPPIASTEKQPSFFRAQTQTPKLSKDIAKVRLDWSEEITYKLQESLELPKLNLPMFSGLFTTLTTGEIENLAEECRERWKLGNAPIENLINSMESNGVVVTHGALGFIKMDGVSRWSSLSGHPHVFLCLDKANGYRRRFDAGHELGHIVLHKNVSDSDYIKHYKLLEQQAHHFASALLLPASSFSRDVQYPTLENFLALKPKWKASAASMIKRCQDLEIIGEHTALRLWKARSARGWVKSEPFDENLPLEMPKLLQRSVKMLIENSILSKSTLRSILGMPASIVEELCNLPVDYFNQDIRSNVIELRLRSKK